jgi:hypothetical protein
LLRFALPQADSLQNRADALLARADSVDTLIDTTQQELVEKRKEFEHYKNRAQTEMAIALQARGAYHINSLRGQTFYEGSCASVHPSTHTQIQHTHTHPANRNVTRPASFARAEALHTIARTHAHTHTRTYPTNPCTHQPTRPFIHPSELTRHTSTNPPTRP